MKSETTKGDTLPIGKFMPPPSGNMSPQEFRKTVELVGPSGRAVVNAEDVEDWKARGYTVIENESAAEESSSEGEGEDTGSKVDWSPYGIDELREFAASLGISKAERKNYNTRNELITWLESKNFVPPVEE